MRRYSRDRPRHIRSSTRRYPWDELPVDGLTPEDIDGDGRILAMRVRDPHGGWKSHPEQPRLLVAREPGPLLHLVTKPVRLLACLPFTSSAPCAS